MPESFTWGSEDGQKAAVEAAFKDQDRFDMSLNRGDYARLLATLVAAVGAVNSDDIPDELREWAESFAGCMVEVDWV